jgi:hypothetical protein
LERDAKLIEARAITQFKCVLLEAPNLMQRIMQSVVAQILSQRLARLALYLALPQAVKQPDDSVNQLRDLERNPFR